MPLFATLLTASLGFLPQGGGDTAQQEPLLSASEQKSLQSKLAKMIEARTEYDEATGNIRTREKAQREYERAKDAFRAEWDSKVEKHGDLMGSFLDLQAIFANCITYERKSGQTMRKVPERDGIPEHCLMVPKKYKSDTPARTVLLVPGREGDKWQDGQRYYDDCWGKKNPAEEDTIFHVTLISDEIDLDPMPDYTSVAGEALEFRRNGELMMSFGETQRSYNVDRSRLFLDAGKGACAYAVRVATHFPDRFAGVVLRHPTEVENIRLGSLGGVKFLMLSSKETAAVCQTLKERLEAVEPGICTIVETSDEYPHQSATEDILKWMDGVQRTVNRHKVVLEPNDDRFRKGFWVGIETMDSIHTAPDEEKPRVVVEADKAQSRISIEAVGIESLYLQLNDELVDLDQEFTIVVNDKAFTEKRSRDFNRMLDFVLQRFDPDFLFPVQFRVKVPPRETRASEAGGEK